MNPDHDELLLRWDGRWDERCEDCNDPHIGAALAEYPVRSISTPERVLRREICYKPGRVDVLGLMPVVSKGLDAKPLWHSDGRAKIKPRFSGWPQGTRVLDLRVLHAALLLPPLHQKVLLTVLEMLSYVPPSDIELRGNVADDGNVHLTREAPEGRAWYQLPDRAFTVRRFTYRRLRNRMRDLHVPTLGVQSRHLLERVQDEALGL